MYISELTLFIIGIYGCGIIGGLLFVNHKVESWNVKLEFDNFKLTDELEICRAVCEGYKNNVQKGIDEWNDFTNAKLECEE